MTFHGLISIESLTMLPNLIHQIDPLLANLAQQLRDFIQRRGLLRTPLETLQAEQELAAVGRALSDQMMESLLVAKLEPISKTEFLFLRVEVGLEGKPARKGGWIHVDGPGEVGHSFNQFSDRGVAMQGRDFLTQPAPQSFDGHEVGAVGGQPDQLGLGHNFGHRGDQGRG